MKRTIAALGIGGVMLATSAAAETIKVATWNIENRTEGSRTVAELSMMAELVDILDAHFSLVISSPAVTTM
jgi:hypothetical protein